MGIPPVLDSVVELDVLPVVELAEPGELEQAVANTANPHPRTVDFMSLPVMVCTRDPIGGVPVAQAKPSSHGGRRPRRAHLC